MVAAGATRIGASAGVRIVQESRGQQPTAAPRDIDAERRAAIAGVLWLCLGAAMAAQATVGQTTTPDRPGPWAVDLRGATVSLPRDAPFFPDIPSSTAVPSRGWGIDVGAHVYVLQLGPARLGIGGMLLRARGTASPGEPDEDEEPSATGLATTPMWRRC